MRRPLGVSLAESLVTLFVLGIVVSLLLSLYPMASLAVERGRHLLQAQMLADSTLESWRARPFEQLAPGSVPLPDATREGLVFHHRLEIFTVAGRDPELLKGLRVDVSWSEQGRPRSLTRELWVSSVEF